MAKTPIDVLDKKTRKKFPPWKTNGGSAAPVRNSKERDALRRLCFR